MAKIITVTANTAIDIFIEVEGLHANDNLQARSSVEFACGKGVNVAKAVESLGFPVLCLGFAGRHSIEAFDKMQSDLLRTDLIAVAGKTRTNITLFDSANSKETHIRTAGFSVTDHDCRELIESIKMHTEPGDIVIISGSLPPGAPGNFYRTLVRRCCDSGSMVYLDASGSGLSKGIEAGPTLIKPNQQELEELIGRPLPDERHIVEAACGLIEQGVREIYVSCGERGCIAVTESDAVSAYLKERPENIVTKVGCGDALVAGLAAAKLQCLSLDETLRLSVACGTANLFSKEPGRFDRGLVADIGGRVILEPIR